MGLEDLLDFGPVDEPESLQACVAASATAVSIIAPRRAARIENVGNMVVVRFVFEFVFAVVFAFMDAS